MANAPIFVIGKPVRTAHASPNDVSPEDVSPEDAARGHSAGLICSEQWCTIEGYQIDLEAVRTHGVPPTSFNAFASRHADDFRIGCD